MTFFRGIAVLGLVLYPCAGLWSLGPVVVSEIHYHPPSTQGQILEFVELYNASAQPVGMANWRLDGAVQYTFGPETILAAGQYAIVCRDKEAFRLEYSGVLPEPLGSYDGALSNGGEVLDLLDGWGALRDSVPYGDSAPWPESADGKGSSLQRICMESPGCDPLNWTGALPPTPGAPHGLQTCPPPQYESPDVVITEIHYHPRELEAEHPSGEDGENTEFIEIRNITNSEIDVGGWRLEDAVAFTFPADTRLGPGEEVVVCRDEESIRNRYGDTNIAGAYVGKLSNDGESIRLVDGGGHVIDAVRYEENGDWPYAADGLGHSLERVVLTAPAQDPANWAISVPQAGIYQHRSAEGRQGQGIVQKFILSVDGDGEVLVDNVLLEDLDDPGVNLLENGGFEEGIDGWSAKGVTEGSTVDDGAGVGGTKGLRLVSSGSCPSGECGESNGVSQSVEGTTFEGLYRVTVDYSYVRGSPLLRAGLFRGAAVAADDFQTPGESNATSADRLPVHVGAVHRFPLEPTSADTTWITALVRHADAPQVELSYSAGDQQATLPMRDDGAHRDGLAGDGVYGVELPAFPHNSQVVFRIGASDGDRRAQWPLARFADAPLPGEYGGYYVNDLKVDSPLPVYHILLDDLEPSDVEADPQSVNEVLSCWALTTAGFACRGDLFPAVKVRFRGNTACFIQKRNFKVIFNRISPFHGLRKINLNGLWTDKAIVREHLAWEFFREIGAPYMETEFVRLHLNGVYHGLFMYLEHHGRAFLGRNDLDSGGNLYKAQQPPPLGGDEVPIGVAQASDASGYRKSWELETNENSNFDDLIVFVDSMHADGANENGPSMEFWRDLTFENMIVRYQLGQVVLNNVDSFAKNHFLYHDLEKDKWGFITWDMDLTFGKFFSRAAVAFPDRPVGTLNDLMLSDPDVQGDLNPWFGATVNGNQLLNWLIEFFFHAGDGYYQRAYLVQLWDILQEKYRNDVYDPRLDELAAMLAGDEAADHERWGRYASNVDGFPEGMLDNIAIVKEQIRLHRKFLIDYIEQWHDTVVDHAVLKITEIMYLPEAGDGDLEYLEIHNVSGRTVDLAGWTIKGIGYTFGEGARVDADEVFIVARSPSDFRNHYGIRTEPQVFGPYDAHLDNGGETLEVTDAGPGYPAIIDHVSYDSEAPWPTVLPGYSIELRGECREKDNDNPANWIRSQARGGSPGVVSRGFVRGNADGGTDGDVNLTDGIFILNHLFRGGRSPCCMDAADANDDGQVDITDAIFLLNFLFLGGHEPPPPYPTRDVDPTPDGLTCDGWIPA